MRLALGWLSSALACVVSPELQMPANTCDVIDFNDKLVRLI